jgi:hypothetical protein
MAKAPLKIDKRHKLDARGWVETSRWVAVKSSNVAAIRYDRGAKRMWVAFKNGSTYACDSFPEELAKQYFVASSMGKFHWKLRRAGYAFRKISSG